LQQRDVAGVSLSIKL